MLLTFLVILIGGTGLALAAAAYSSGGGVTKCPVLLPAVAPLAC